MNIGRLVFAQIMDVLDPKQLTLCIDRYPMPALQGSIAGLPLRSSPSIPPLQNGEQTENQAQG